MQTSCVGCDEPSLGEHQGKPSASQWDAGIIKLAVALLFAGQSMVFSLAINLSPSEEPGMRLAVQGLVLAATLIVLALLGSTLLHAAATELLHGRLTIEVLFVTTILGALAASLQSFLTGAGPIFTGLPNQSGCPYPLPGRSLAPHARGRGTGWLTQFADDQKWGKGTHFIW